MAVSTWALVDANNVITQLQIGGTQTNGGILANGADASWIGTKQWDSDKKSWNDVVTVVSKLDFSDLFTDAEFDAIQSAIATDPDVNRWWTKAMLADQIDLLDPRTKDGLDLCISKGLLTAARETQILNNQPPA